MTVPSSAHVKAASFTSPALLAGDLVVLVVGKDRNSGGVGGKLRGVVLAVDEFNRSAPLQSAMNGV